MRKLITVLSIVMIVSSVASAADVAGWESFVIRNSSSGDTPPTITDETTGTYAGYKVFDVELAGQKAGWGTNNVNGKKVGDLQSLSIVRHSDIADGVDQAGDPIYGPYFNIWITDGSGEYAVLANEPSNPEWNTDDPHNTTWDILKDKTAKVYEDNAAFTLPSGSTYTFSDFSDYTIATPSTHWGGTGAPDDLNATNYTAYGFNWVFGDTQSNYVGEYPVTNPTAVPEPTTIAILGLGGLSLFRRKRKA